MCVCVSLFTVECKFPGRVRSRWLSYLLDLFFHYMCLWGAWLVYLRLIGSRQKIAAPIGVCVTDLSLIASSSTGGNLVRADDVHIHVHGAAAPMLLWRAWRQKSHILSNYTASYMIIIIIIINRQSHLKVPMTMKSAFIGCGSCCWLPVCLCQKWCDI